MILTTIKDNYSLAPLDDNLDVIHYFIIYISSYRTEKGRRNVIMSTTPTCQRPPDRKRIILMPVGTILLSFYTLLPYLRSGRTLASTTTVIATYATRGGIRIVINNKTGVNKRMSCRTGEGWYDDCTNYLPTSCWTKRSVVMMNCWYHHHYMHLRSGGRYYLLILDTNGTNVERSETVFVLQLTHYLSCKIDRRTK